jgi:hypothetical protein
MMDRLKQFVLQFVYLTKNLDGLTAQSYCRNSKDRVGLYQLKEANEAYHKRLPHPCRRPVSD